MAQVYYDLSNGEIQQVGDPNTPRNWVQSNMVEKQWTKEGNFAFLDECFNITEPEVTNRTTKITTYQCFLPRFRYARPGEDIQPSSFEKFEPHPQDPKNLRGNLFLASGGDPINHVLAYGDRDRIDATLFGFDNGILYKSNQPYTVEEPIEDPIEQVVNRRLD
jgi:hypothetical protein